MFSNYSLRAKLILLGVLLSVIPLITIAIATYSENTDIIETAADGLSEVAYADLDHIVQGVLSMIESQQEVLQQDVKNALNVARKLIAVEGGVNVDPDRPVAWNAVNQYDKTATAVNLPRMMLGGRWLGKNSDIDTETPLVDDVAKLVGGTCTVFQRMNSAGDMLRVATNVEKLDHQRAIGTFIPAVNPTGEKNPVVSQLAGGNTYYGRAYVVNAWYITAYEPILDDAGELIGALYFGIKQESATALRKAVKGTIIGETGYVSVLDSNGNYIISKNGELDGENVMSAVDANGKAYIRDIIDAASDSEQGDILQYAYEIQRGETGAVGTRVAKLSHYKPWDWIIVAGTFEDEFFSARDEILENGRHVMNILFVVIGITLTITLLVWYVFSSRISRKLASFSEGMFDGADEVATAAAQVSDSSQSLASGASEQAASIEETSSSLEEMSAMTRQNAENARQADGLMMEANGVIERANAAMDQMTASIQRIADTGEKTQKIVKTIDEIAFQTNLLALNAAVEAARAGEAGAGFAVVADEVRSLALRAAEAAKNTSELIESSVHEIGEGGRLVDSTNRAFDEVADHAKKVAELIGEISASSTEQAQGIEQVNKAVVEVDKVVQENAAVAEESASAAEEMNAQALNMKSQVEALLTMVNGRSDSDLSGSRGARNNGRVLGRKTERGEEISKKYRMLRLALPAGSRTAVRAGA